MLYKPALWVFLMIGDRGLVEADLRAMNLRLATSKRRAQARSIVDMAENHSNGYVYEKLLKKRRLNSVLNRTLN